MTIYWTKSPLKQRGQFGKIVHSTINGLIMAMSTKEEEKVRVVVSGFCEVIVSTAVFEYTLEDILNKKAAEAKGTFWKNRSYCRVWLLWSHCEYCCI